MSSPAIEDKSVSNYHYELHVRRGDGLYVVLELFENGSILIFDVKSGKTFKVNGHRLKPYLIVEVDVHLLEAHEDVTSTSPSPHQSS